MAVSAVTLKDTDYETVVKVTTTGTNTNASIIDEIVVTASKEDSQILKVGGNISSINTDEIKFISAINPSEILNRLPAVYISQGSGQEHLTSIRSPVLSGAIAPIPEIKIPTLEKLAKPHNA